MKKLRYFFYFLASVFVILEGKGIIMKSILPLMKGMFNTELQTSFNKLKINIEQHE